MSDTVEIEIDGKRIQVPQGSMIIEAADANGVEVPRFCYHEKLSVAANCRMCLVEVEKMPKPVPACATPITPGMKIFTTTPKVKDAQRAVMEFLLINHPLDCPICDQGGECELQDNSMGFGSFTSPYDESKISVEEKNIGPLVQTALTRCIQCTRCVRFGQEIAGVRELGMIHRGERSEIATFVEKSLTSEVSANIIDICPVGALVSKPFLYQARAWELTQHPSIAMHDALGSHIYLHTRRNEIMRTVPKENEDVNEVWLSDRDRFSYLGCRDSDRLLSPMIKQNGEWVATDWETALNKATQSIREISKKYGPQSLLALTAPNTTLEEYYLLQQIWKSLGATDLTYELRASEVCNEPYFGLSLAELEQQNQILIIGSEVHREIPLLNLRFRKAALNGAQIDAINTADYPYNFPINTKCITAPQQWGAVLSGVLYHLLANADQKHPLQALAPMLNCLPEYNDFCKNIAHYLQQSKKSFIYLGALAYHAPDSQRLRALTQAIAQLTHSEWGTFTDGSNSTGLAALTRTENHTIHTLTEILPQAKHKAILLHKVEPLLDCANPFAVNQLLDQAETVIALTSFKSPQLMLEADVLLPIGTLGETSGTYVNMLSHVQNFTGCVSPLGEARPAWKVFRVLANLLQVEGMTYTNSEDVLEEIRRKINFSEKSQENMESLIATIKKSTPKNEAAAELYRLTQWPLYRVDPLVRRAPALQACGSATLVGAYMNQKTCDQLHFTPDQTILVQQGGTATLSVIIDNKLPDNAVFIPAGFNETSLLGENFGTIHLRSIE